MNKVETQEQEKTKDNNFKGNSMENSNVSIWKLNLSVYSATV